MILTEKNSSGPTVKQRFHGCSALTKADFLGHCVCVCADNLNSQDRTFLYIICLHEITSSFFFCLSIWKICSGGAGRREE